MHLCQCGCGKEVTKEINKFISGHNTLGLKRDPSIALKRKHTCMNRYGVESVTQLDDMKEKSKKTCLEKYGVEHTTQAKEIKEKIEKTCIEKYGVKSHNQSNIIKNKKKESYQKHYGVDHPSKSNEIKEKKKLTCLINFGVEHPGQSNEVKEKNKLACMERYGVENPSQSMDIHNKKLKNSFRRKKYILPSGKEILLQGEEPQFLDYVFFNNLLKEEDFIFHPKGIKYSVNGNNHYYFPDFLILKFNLITEIKSSYILSIQPNNDLKINAALNSGYKYIMIVDKKFEKFKNLIHQLSEQNLNIEEFQNAK